MKKITFSQFLLYFIHKFFQSVQLFWIIYMTPFQSIENFVSIILNVLAICYFQGVFFAEPNWLLLNQE